MVDKTQGTPQNNAPEQKMVSVPEATLKTILDEMENNKVDRENTKKELESSRAKIADLEKSIGEVESTASQDQIMKIERLRASGKLVKAVRLNFFDELLVISWKPTIDDVYIDNTGKEISVQKTQLTFLDGTQREVPQIDFTRKKLQRQYEVIEEGKDQNGNINFKVLMEGGKEVTINSIFVN